MFETLNLYPLFRESGLRNLNYHRVWLYLHDLLDGCHVQSRICLFFQNTRSPLFLGGLLCYFLTFLCCEMMFVYWEFFAIALPTFFNYAFDIHLVLSVSLLTQPNTRLSWTYVLKKVKAIPILLLDPAMLLIGSVMNMFFSYSILYFRLSFVSLNLVNVYQF